MAPDPHGATAEVASPTGAGDEATAPVPAVAETPHPNRMAAVYTPRPAAPPAAAPDEKPAAAAAAPQGRKVRRGRRVKRVIRRIELWSVLKLALVFYTCMYVVVMAALVALWSFAYSAGLVDNFESFANDVGFEHWQFYGEQMFHQAAVIGAVLVVAATVVTVLATALLNVVSELTGGIRVVVIEEEITYLPAVIEDDEPAAPAAEKHDLRPVAIPPGSGRRSRRR